MNRKLAIVATLAAATLALGACGSSSSSGASGSAAAGDAVTLKVGVNPVPHGDILKFVKDNLAAKAGLNIDIVEYSDYVLPNKNLDNGQLDANYFQHLPYYESQVKEFGYKFEHGEGVHIEPYAVYSKKVKDLKDLPDGATISIVNDPANQNRALVLLAKQGLITVDEGKKDLTIHDVKDNPKHISFQEIEAPNLPRTLDSVDASVINGNFALQGGLTPSKDAIALEDGKDNPYANFLAWKADAPAEKKAAVKKLDELLHSPEVAKFIKDKYADGAVIPAFGN
ncbi:D-methionine transport system substrate-binding protein [Arcanobacterium wilhelmae]|uniref:Lipoprotein n=1 Tax=Arcanobacterium wilhelmae TaxID=1803177 RepID=A0ABT9NAZ8_9ACTO|nr:MetQ/NlpA family ABC transporter substrate-binding protein [Arcanobacterium wilhelmae]MDP9800688.1 D-methionine transport system substrate-binding protein [Arcanobacterium wilhelmae]